MIFDWNVIVLSKWITKFFEIFNQNYLASSQSAETKLQHIDTILCKIHVRITNTMVKFSLAFFLFRYFKRKKKEKINHLLISYQIETLPNEIEWKNKCALIVQLLHLLSYNGKSNKRRNSISISITIFFFFSFSFLLSKTNLSRLPLRRKRRKKKPFLGAIFIEVNFIRIWNQFIYEEWIWFIL